MPDLLNQNQKTDALTIPRSQIAATVIGMAHFAGTGPFGMFCNDCAFYLIPIGKKKLICDKYRQLTGDKNKPIPSSSPACRYFEAKGKA